MPYHHSHASFSIVSYSSLDTSFSNVYEEVPYTNLYAEKIPYILAEISLHPWNIKKYSGKFLNLADEHIGSSYPLLDMHYHPIAIYSGLNWRAIHLDEYPWFGDSTHTRDLIRTCTKVCNACIFNGRLYDIE